MAVFGMRGHFKEAGFQNYDYDVTNSDLEEILRHTSFNLYVI